MAVGMPLSTSTVVQVHEPLAFTSEPLMGCASHLLLSPLARYLLVTNKSPYKRLTYHVLGHADASTVSVVDAGKWGVLQAHAAWHGAGGGAGL